MRTISERLQIALDAMTPRGSQADLMRACGVSNASVSNWFSGKTKSIKGLNLLLAAEYLGVRPIWLAAGTGPMRLAAPSLDRAVQADEPVSATYGAKSSAESFVQQLVRLVSTLPDNEWAAIRIQLDGLSEGRYSPEAVLQSLHRLIGTEAVNTIASGRHIAGLASRKTATG